MMSSYLPFDIDMTLTFNVYKVLTLVMPVSIRNFARDIHKNNTVINLRTCILFCIFVRLLSNLLSPKD